MFLVPSHPCPAGSFVPGGACAQKLPAHTENPLFWLIPGPVHTHSHTHVHPHTHIFSAGGVCMWPKAFMLGAAELPRKPGARGGSSVRARGAWGDTGSVVGCVPTGDTALCPVPHGLPTGTHQGRARGPAPPWKLVRVPRCGRAEELQTCRQESRPGLTRCKVQGRQVGLLPASQPSCPSGHHNRVCETEQASPGVARHTASANCHTGVGLRQVTGSWPSPGARGHWAHMHVR